MTTVDHRLMGIVHYIGRWYAGAAILLVSLTCIGWVWLLAGMGTVTPVAKIISTSTGESIREPITPVPAPPPADPGKLALGEALFGDPRLFATGHLACVTCHDVHGNGASPNRFEVVSGVPLRVNTPTVFNAALNFRLDWTGDQRTLEQQVISALRVHGSIANDPDQVAARLNETPDTKNRFLQVYGHAADQANLLDAIATYERSLVTPGSRFDRWLEGDQSALSANEVQGYRYFKSMGCIACHQGENVGGNLFEHSGVFHPLTDSGPIRLRVPPLRNVATTAPYFHDGSAPTLEDAVRRMASAQLNRKLTDPETQAIVAFLNTLTGDFDGTPVRTSAP
jgi:cytochrome c peroxidase